MSYNFFEHSPVPACILEPTLLIRKVNTAFSRSFGYSKSELEGIEYWNRICEFKTSKPNLCDPSLWPSTNVLDETPAYSVFILTKHGFKKEFMVSFAFDPDELQIFAYLESPQFQERPFVRYDAVVGPSFGNDLEKPADSWVQKQKLEAIGTLSAGVAHEINNPLMGVINYAEMVFNGIETGNPLRKYAGIILQESNRISEIVKDMLTFTRLEKEEAKVHDLTTVFCSTFGLLKSGFRKAGIETVAPSLDIPIYAVCSAGRLRQVYLNLLTNAKDAIESNPDSAKDKTVTVYWQKFKKGDRNFVRTIIEDTGPGISEENRHKLFDPFYTTKEIGKGTGLGLTVSYNLVREMGGDLSFECTDGTTRFYVDLPESF
ncbi:sensor histidine kinase [Leptospira yasudae]|uniref:PAS domain-containing sensor histidine kinase n=1 Tax=Leptospira yasudae TaxID=2202201 RepID=UPI000E59AF98|nr:PAS domain-containing sensor histidine kinase [Leptospira yasudae]RHX93923.1 sensor histidine kinase [Leptospira yasudae]TGK25740.1 sensor histidine kinase [Leptospira yasudae]TGM02840.1 sensor histidine kinase [Leptospira yasudae]